jgi:membrane protease YdiL (CAAX protease family)
MIYIAILGVGIIAPRIVPDPENPFAPSLAIVGLCLFLGLSENLGLVYYGSVKQPRRTWRELGWHTDDLGKQILPGVIGGVAISAFLLLLLQLWGHPLSETIGHIKGYSLAERGVFLMIGIAGSTVEESLFRGNLQPILSKRLGAAGGLLITSIVFMAYHVNNLRPLSIIFKTTAGMVYGGLYLWRRSLVAPVVAHTLSWVIVGSL